MRELWNKSVTFLTNVYEANLANMYHLCLFFSCSRIEFSNHPAFRCHAWVGLTHWKDQSAWCIRPDKRTHRMATTESSYLLIGSLCTCDLRIHASSGPRLTSALPGQCKSQDDTVLLTFLLLIMSSQFKQDRPHLSHRSVSRSQVDPDPRHLCPFASPKSRDNWSNILEGDWHFSQANDTNTNKLNQGEILWEQRVDIHSRKSY